jgi:hypothetical protein
LFRKRSTLVLMSLVAVIAAFAAGPSFGSSGKSARHSDPPCSINPNPVSVDQTYVVSVSGLPTDTAINLWVTDPSGNTVGSPLGSAPTGSFDLNESSSSAGTWTYTFSGPTKQKTTVYASCSVSAS